MKVLLVGFGRWGEAHRRVLDEIGAEVWVAERDEARRRAAAAAGVRVERVVADVRVALPEVEAVDVVTPADSHLGLARQALRAGKPCFVEKPAARTVAEGRALAALAARTGCPLQVGHIYRFHPVTDALRELLATGAVGRVRYGQGRFVGFKRPRPDAGVTRSDAIHWFDLFACVLSHRATAVTAVVRDHLGRGMDDCAFAVVEYGRVPILVESGYFAPETRRDCVIVGERGAIVADFATCEVRVHGSRHVRGVSGWHAEEGPVEVLKAAGPEPLRRQLEAFLDAASGRAPCPVDVRTGVAALEVAEAVERSARQGRRVVLRERP
jgi:UDP-N-acetylglucosamine 3-dehydrogenase